MDDDEVAPDASASRDNNLHSEPPQLASPSERPSSTTSSWLIDLYSHCDYEEHNVENTPAPIQNAILDEDVEEEAMPATPQHAIENAGEYEYEDGEDDWETVCSNEDCNNDINVKDPYPKFPPRSSSLKATGWADHMLAVGKELDLEEVLEADRANARRMEGKVCFDDQRATFRNRQHHRNSSVGQWAASRPSHYRTRVGSPKRRQGIRSMLLEEGGHFAQRERAAALRRLNSESSPKKALGVIEPIDAERKMARNVVRLKGYGLDKYG